MVMQMVITSANLGVGPRVCIPSRRSAPPAPRKGVSSGQQKSPVGNTALKADRPWKFLLRRLRFVLPLALHRHLGFCNVTDF